RDQNRPYFAFLNYFDAHSPYIPAPEARQQFGEKVPKDPHMVIWETYPPDQIEALRDAYERGELGIDMEMGRLLDKLREQGDLDNTLVVIASDHGEHFGERTFMDHAWTLYMELLHVPLVLIAPFQVPTGKIICQPVSLRDLPATIMEV